MGLRSPSYAHTSLARDVLLPLTPQLLRHLFGGIRVSAQLGLRAPRGVRWSAFLENADALRSNAQLRPRLIQFTPLVPWNRQLKLPATNSNSVDLTALLALLQPLDLTSDTRLRG